MKNNYKNTSTLYIYDLCGFIFAIGLLLAFKVSRGYVSYKAEERFMHPEGYLILKRI